MTEHSYSEEQITFFRQAEAQRIAPANDSPITSVTDNNKLSAALPGLWCAVLCGRR